MSFFIPRTPLFDSLIVDTMEERYWKLLIDNDGDGDFDDPSEDYTSRIQKNSLTLEGRRSGASNEAVANSGSVAIRNSDQALEAGDLSGCMVQIQAKVGTSEYITVATMWVTESGAQRAQRWLHDDVIKLDFIDWTGRIAAQRNPDAAALVGYTICNTTTTAESLLHYLATAMGLSTGGLDVADIPYPVSYALIDGKTTAWKELQDIAQQYLGLLTFRYDGKLRFSSRFETGWSAPTSEWTFDESNIHKVTTKKTSLIANKVTTEYDEYLQLDPQVIYKNTDEYDTATRENAIVVAAGDYWPGPTSGDRAQLEYADPDSGEQFPLGTAVQAPTIGATGSGSDIECDGGLLTLVSFNNSTSATGQGPGYSEIILQNGTGSDITITKLEIRGTPHRVNRTIKVEAADATVTNEWQIKEKSIPGKYASTPTQANETCEWWVEYGKPRRQFEIDVDWIPFVQEGAIVTIDHPSIDGSTVDCYIDSWSHPAAGGSMAKQFTTLVLIEAETFAASGASRSVVRPSLVGLTPSIQSISADISDRPTYTELQDGYNAGGGTTTPSAPSGVVANANLRDILIYWQPQAALTSFDHYELQCRESGDSDWYAPRSDYDTSGVWHDAADTVLVLYELNYLHRRIQNGGTSGVPTGRTVEYRVRTVTKDSTGSSWSSTASATTYPILDEDLSENAITSDKMATDSVTEQAIVDGAVTEQKVSTGFLEAVVASIRQFITISETSGFTGANYDLSDGSYVFDSTELRAYLDQDEVTFQKQIAIGATPTWEDTIKLSATVDGLRMYEPGWGMTLTGTGVEYGVRLAKDRADYTSYPSGMPDYPALSLESDGLITFVETDSGIVRGYIDANTGSMRLDGDTTISGTLSAGNTTISGTLSAGNTTISGTLSAGNTTISGTFSVLTSGAERMRIDASGNVQVNNTFSSGNLISSKISINRSASANTGINFYSEAINAWQIYMSPAGQTSAGYNGNLTAPSGTYVTSWALRSVIEPVAGYGWTWEEVATNTDYYPTVVAELRSSDGVFRTKGSIRAGDHAVLSTGGAAGYYQDATNGAYRAITTSCDNGYYFQSYNGATTMMYVGLTGTYAGRVGIGTKAPAYKLDVKSALSVAINGETDGNYGVYGSAYHSTGGSYGVYGAAYYKAVSGYAYTSYAVSGNTAYYNSSTKYQKQIIEHISVSDLLRKKPLNIYKWQWEDSNLRGFDQFISPFAEDIKAIFDLTEEYEGTYTVDGIALALGSELLQEQDWMKYRMQKLEARVAELEAVNGN